MSQKELVKYGVQLCNKCGGSNVHQKIAFGNSECYSPSKKNFGITGIITTQCECGNVLTEERYGPEDKKARSS